ncbi:hypothetical protein MASR2M48_05940 [Spirochaetota bacterium]
MSIDRRFIRHYILLCVLIIAAGFTLVRYGSLAFSSLDSPISSSPSRVISIRGPIYDREGRLLAVDTNLYDISIWKPSISKGREKAFAQAIAVATGIDESELMAKMTEEGADFTYLARRVSGDVAKEVEKAISETNMNGVKLDRVSGRIYPERALAAHLIGFVGTENFGLSGAEAAFDAVLAADASRASGGYAYGDSVYLTIDADLQFRLESLARDVMVKNDADAVALVAMEAKTGSILSYVSLPDYDPNEFLAADQATWVDRVSIYAYEPGSVFKVYSMGALMALGGIDSKSVFYCDGSYDRDFPSGDSIVIKCLGSHGLVNVTKILEYSCNAGAAYASDTVSPMDFYATIREFGFGERAGADPAGESPGLIRRPEDRSARTKPTIAIGQELLVTALQMATAGTVVANGGLLVRLSDLVAHSQSRRGDYRESRAYHRSQGDGGA